LRVRRLRLQRGEPGARRQRVALGGGAQVDQIRLRLGQLALGIERLQHDVGVRELEEDGALLDRRARPQRDALDPPGGVRGDQPDLLRHQRPGPLHFAQHRPALDAICPERAPVHDGRRRPQPGQRNRD